jgi:protein O-mannosyl-transferase
MKRMAQFPNFIYPFLHMAPNGQTPLVKYLICLLLAGIILAAFAGVAHAGFIVLDDRNYVTEHPAIQNGFTWKSIKWAFIAFDSENWHPLTWLSLMLDYQAFGLNPTGYHLINLAFHIANTVLLFFLLERLTARSWPSAFVALLFGIHPMHVESVAWVSERKDVLSAFFFLLTLMAYVRYAQSVVHSPSPVAPAFAEASAGREAMADRQSKSPNPQSATGDLSRHGEAKAGPLSRRWLFYALALFLFALGLMSKPMLVTLPFVLLLLDFWPLQRFTLMRNDAPKQSKGRPSLSSRRSWVKANQRLVIEKSPFFIASALSCYVTYLAQRHGGAIIQPTEHPILLRISDLSISYAWYILKLFWPVHLSVFYPLWTEIFIFDVLFAGLGLVIITAFAFWIARKYPYFLFGWLWFLGILVPVIGLVQAGSQAYADRYAYLPYIGLFIILAWGVPDLIANAGTARCAFRAASGGATGVVGRSPVPPRGIPPGLRTVTVQRALLWAGAAFVAIACFVRTIQEVGYWNDGIALFGRAAALDPKNEEAWTLLGAEYSSRRDDAKALDCLNRALALGQNFYLPWQAIGFIRAREGDYNRAAQAYQTALQYTHFGPFRMDIYNNLGQAYRMTTNENEAISAYESSLAISSDQPAVQAALGQCLLDSKQPEQAVADFRAAIDLDPNNAGAQLGLGMCLASAGRDAEALGHFRAAVKADANSAMALNNLAWLLATDPDPALRNGPEAVSLAERACQLTDFQDAQSIGTLAAAYAEAGRFDEAIATARKAYGVALADGERDIADRNAQLLKLYEAHKPYHMADVR